MAVHERGHCVVLAGPGSGKTKTLTTAMARALTDDVVDPRGVACITYNNECALELEARLSKLDIKSDERVFIGTVHSFALTQIIAPYARCIPGLLPEGFRIATRSEIMESIQAAHRSAFPASFSTEDPYERWSYAEEKRRRDVDRTLAGWWGNNPELAHFIEQYEVELRRKGLLDFDDMPLLAFRMIKEHQWIREALRARFPVLFVDEYQDLGHALHELVLLLCFQSAIRLFAVGDADQSIYGFTGANPELLQALTRRDDVRTFRLRFNYRSGSKIIRASLGALGEERDYQGIEGAPDGALTFWPVEGAHVRQAEVIAGDVIPSLISRGFEPEQIAVLYRAAWLGDKVAQALEIHAIAFVRADSNALVKRSSRLARFIEACASWVAGGWRNANPPFDLLGKQAIQLVFGGRSNEREVETVLAALTRFLNSSRDMQESTNSWLCRFHRDLVTPWQAASRNPHEEWEICAEMIKRTDGASGQDMPLNVFAGKIEGSGRVTLSTLHSAKGREFDAVIMYGINNTDLPSTRDLRSTRTVREARRLFYVGVTRPKKELCLVFRANSHSPWVEELYNRTLD